MGAQHSSDEVPLMDRSVPCEACDLEQSWVSPFALRIAGQEAETDSRVEVDPVFVENSR